MTRMQGRWPNLAAIGWTVLFAGMSFYWAMGGMLGTQSLGGGLYMLAGRRPNKVSPQIGKAADSAGSDLR